MSCLFLFFFPPLLQTLSCLGERPRRRQTPHDTFVCFMVTYFKPHVFRWLRERFQHDLHLVKRQDKHGVGGDPCLSRISAPGNTCLQRRRAERRKNKRGSQESREQKGCVWFTLVLTVDSLSLSVADSSLAAHVPAIYTPGPLSLSAALLFGYYSTSTRTNIPIRGKADKQETVAGSLGGHELKAWLFPYFCFFQLLLRLGMRWYCFDIVGDPRLF